MSFSEEKQKCCWKIKAWMCFSFFFLAPDNQQLALLVCGWNPRLDSAHTSNSGWCCYAPTELVGCEEKIDAIFHHGVKMSSMTSEIQCYKRSFMMLLSGKPMLVSGSYLMPFCLSFLRYHSRKIPGPQPRVRRHAIPSRVPWIQVTPAGATIGKRNFPPLPPGKAQVNSSCKRCSLGTGASSPGLAPSPHVSWQPQPCGGQRDWCPLYLNCG